MNEETRIETISDPKPAKKGGPRKAVVGAVVGILALAAVAKAYGAYTFGQTHAETDNAYVTGDLVGISPAVAGTLVELKVQDGDFVKKGQLIARLDTAGAQAELDQAEANYQAAQTQVPQAESALTFEKLSTAAAIQRSEAAIAAQSAKTAGSRLQVRLSSDTVRNGVRQAESTLAQAVAQADQAKAQAAQAQAGIANAQAALESARQAVETARKNAEAQTATVKAAKAEADRAAGDLSRYGKLLASEAISKQQYDNASASATAAQSNYESAQGRAQAAQSAVTQAQAGVAQAQASLVAARRQADAAQRQADAVAKQVQVAQAGVDLARSRNTEVGIRDADVQQGVGETSQATADLASAQAGSQQVALREKQIATARAQVEQARAAVERARVRVRDANLYAPCDGYVVKHTVNVGTAINPGQNVVTITRGGDVWIMANFKETQLAGMAPGRPAEIAVDAFPGKTFHGRVQSVLRATGSATTLLPPDNSTGNFTKVVQRIPVRISIDPSPGSSEIRQGMSVIVTVDTGKTDVAREGR